MKLNKFVILLGVVVVAGLAFIMSSEKASEKVTGVADDKKVKVGFVYLTTPGDHGWTYAHEVGRQDVIKHFGDKVETTFVENVPEDPMPPASYVIWLSKVMILSLPLRLGIWIQP